MEAEIISADNHQMSKEWTHNFLVLRSNIIRINTEREWVQNMISLIWCRVLKLFCDRDI